MKLADSFFERLLADPDPSQALFQLDALWCARPGRSESLPQFGLSRTEYLAHLFLLYVCEVGNGGHAQFFLNPTGRYAVEARAALQELGLDGLHAVLLEACSVFPDGQVPTDDDEREVLVGGVAASGRQRWDTLDKRLYAADRDSCSRVMLYVKMHRDDVLVSERSA